MRTVNRHFTGERAWCALMAMIVGYELAAPDNQLLSHAVDRWLQKHPVLTYAAVAVTAAHLVNLMPEAVDPYRHVGQAAQRLRVRHPAAARALPDACALAAACTPPIDNLAA
jgi:hypothetical protein